ncbi:MAG: Gfo/Idh/MocA family oxidoreductase [Candidatus Krumholzibacteriia bacterium]
MTRRVGIVGAGTHGARYLNHLRLDVDGLEPVAIARRDEAAGRELARRHQVAWLADGAALIDRPDVDAVIVATPPSSHARFAELALRAGKPLLLEKPMTGTLAEARGLVELAAGRPTALMVAQTLRWNPVLRRVKERWPELGRVHHLRLCQRLEPTSLGWQRNVQESVGGSVLLTGVHVFDLARWLTGREVVTVDSRQRQVLNPVVEDFFLCRGELDDGAWVSFEVSKYTRSRACWLEAVGEDGQIFADYLRGGLVLRRGRDEEREDIDARVPTLPAVLAAWRDALDAGGPLPVTALDGLRTLEIVDACYVSARERCAVATAASGSV